MKNAPLKTNYDNANIISHLHKVKRISDGRYIALCPCHNDKKPSLNVAITPEGVVLIKCFACGATGLDVCEALGVKPSSLFPPNDNPSSYEIKKRQGFSAWQMLHAIEKDALVVLIAARMLLSGEILPEYDVTYLGEVVVRISEALRYLEDSR